MNSRLSCALIVEDEADTPDLEGLGLEKQESPMPSADSVYGAPRAMDGVNPIVIKLDKDQGGPNLEQVSGSLVFSAEGYCQTEEVPADESQARSAMASGELRGSGIEAEWVFLAKEIHVDLGSRRVTVVGRQLTSSKIHDGPFRCTECGSWSPDFQEINRERVRYGQSSGGTVVLNSSSSPVGRRLSFLVSRAWGLLTWSGTGLRDLAGAVSTARKLSTAGRCRTQRQGQVGGVKAVEPLFPPGGDSGNGALQRFVSTQVDKKEQPPHRGSASEASCEHFIEPSMPEMDVLGTGPVPGCDSQHNLAGMPSDNQYPRIGATQAAPVASQRRFLGSKTESFFQALFEAYSKIAGRGGNDPLVLAPVVPLVDVYESLCWPPAHTGKYSKNEFAQDIYRLHRSGIDSATFGIQVSFPISRGVPEKTFVTTDENGVEKRYFGVRFMKVAASGGDFPSGIEPHQLPI